MRAALASKMVGSQWVSWEELSTRMALVDRLVQVLAAEEGSGGRAEARAMAAGQVNLNGPSCHGRRWNRDEEGGAIPTDRLRGFRLP